MSIVCVGVLAQDCITHYFPPQVVYSDLSSNPTHCRERFPDDCYPGVSTIEAPQSCLFANLISIILPSAGTTLQVA